MKFIFSLAIVLLIFSQQCFSQSEITLIPDDYNIPLEKNPGEAFLLSLLLPGAGQMHNDEIGKGFTFFSIVAASNIFVILEERNTVTYMLSVVALATWVYAIIDAPLTAQSINEEIRKKKAKLKMYEHQLLLDIKSNTIGHDINGNGINSLNLCLSISL